MRDETLDWLLSFDRRRYWLVNGWSIRFRAWTVNVNEARPFGIRYALTLHDVDGERLLGFDNAHSIPKTEVHDHRHPYKRIKDVKPYVFESADKLVVDFFDAVKGACDLEGFEFVFDDELLEEIDPADCDNEEV